MEKLHLVSKRNGEKELQVLSWSKTRWGSLLVALRRLIDLRYAILQIPDDDDIATARDAIREQEWRDLKAMCKILKPVETMSQSQGGQKYPTLSSCLILLRHGRNALKNPVEGETETVKNFRETLRNALKAKVQWSTEEATLVIMAMMLDPRYRNYSTCQPIIDFHPLKASHHWNLAKKELIARVSKCIKAAGFPSEDNAFLELPECIFGDPWGEMERRKARPVQAVQPHIIGNRAKEAVERYLDGRPISMRDKNGDFQDIFTWWKIQDHVYPFVAMVARTVLAVPASSVPSERVFSKAGELFSKQRLRMTPEAVDLQLFLHYNKERMKDYNI